MRGLYEVKEKLQLKLRGTMLLLEIFCHFILVHVHFLVVLSHEEDVRPVLFYRLYGQSNFSGYISLKSC